MRRVRFRLPVTGGMVLLALASSLQASVIDLSPERKAPEDNYNLKIGTLRLAFTGTEEIGYDDNITQSSGSTGQSSVAGPYLRQGLTTGINWPVSPYLTVDTAVGIAYLYYPGNTAFNDFEVTGDNGLLSARVAANLRLGQTGRLVLADTLSRTSDSLSIAAANSGANGSHYNLTRNELSLQYDTDITETLHGAAKYGHTAAWASPTAFSYEDNQSDMLDFVLLRELTREWRLGPYFTVTDTYYTNTGVPADQRRNDNVGYNTGLAGTYTRSAGFTAQGRLGYQMVQYQSTNTAAAAGSSGSGNSAGGLTADLGATLMASEFWRHSVFASYGSQQANLVAAVDYSNDFQIGYNVAYRMTPDVYLRGDTSYLLRKESGNGDTVELIRGGIGPGWQMGRATAIDLRYQYTTTSSTNATRGYDQNVVSMTLTHHF